MISIIYTLAGVLLSVFGVAGVVMSISVLLDKGEQNPMPLLAMLAGLSAAVGPLCIALANGWIS